MARQHWGGGDQLTEDLQIPFRVLPIRGTRSGESAVLIAGAAVSVAAWILAVSLRHGASATELVVVSLLFGSILAFIGFVLIRRERQYFGVRGRYWLQIDRKRLAIVVPDGQETYDWRNLTRFVVEKDERITMNTETHVENSITVYVTAVDAGPNSRRIEIVADDFAAKLPGNHVERAQKFCSILNDLRNWAADSTAPSLSRRSVSGLVIATA